MIAEYTKPLPAPDPDSQQFWDACRAHELRGQRCSACGIFRWPPQAFCPECYSGDFEWVPLPGTGTIYTFVGVHYVSVPAFQEDSPYVIAHVSLDGTNERMRLVSNVLDCPWDQVKVGMRVRVDWDDVTPEMTLPKFRPM